MNNPFQAILDIRKGERAFSFLMAAYFFLVITTFWVLKPIKKSAFVGYYKSDGFQLLNFHFTAANAELLAKVANMLVAMAAVILFSYLSKYFIKQQLTFIISGGFMACFALFSLVLNQTSGLLAWAFYLFGDLYSTLMVATFFVFLNDSVTSNSAKRLYGLVGLGGVLGGAFGSLSVGTLVKAGTATNAVWMWLCFALTLFIIVLSHFAAKNLPKKPSSSDHNEFQKTDQASKKNPAFEGALLVLRSPYLFSIVTIVGLYEIASTLLDYQFTSTILHFVEKSKLSEAFNNAYMLMNIVAVVVQLFLTSFIMKRFGLKIALMILPLAILTISAGYLILPILAFATLMPSAEGGLAYSLNQSAKEALYVPTSRDEKYKAKAFIDMFVQRFAKVLAIVVTLIITHIFKDFSSIRWLSIGTVIVVFLWLIAVHYAGTRFEKLSKKGA